MFSNTSMPFTMNVEPVGGSGGGWGNDGWGSWLWVIVILALFGGWGGYGGGAFGGSTGSGITDGYILTSDFANIERKIDGVNNGLCDGFYAMNTGMLNGFAGVNSAITNQTASLGAQLTALGTQQAQCCCDQRYQSATQFSDLNYNLATQTCQTRQAVADASRDIITSQDNGTRAILAAIQAQADAAKDEKIAALQSQLSDARLIANNAAQTQAIINELKPCPSPAFIVPAPFGYNCGCGCNQ